MLSLLFFCRISEDKRKGLCCSGKFGTIQQNSVRKGVCDVEVYEGGLITLLGCVEPLTATLTTALFMHTAFAGMDLIGFAFILATVFILAKKA